jgi:hypothetical protein
VIACIEAVFDADESADPSIQEVARIAHEQIGGGAAADPETRRLLAGRFAR